MKRRSGAESHKYLKTISEALSAAYFPEKNPRCFTDIGIPRKSMTVNISSQTFIFSPTAASLWRR